MAVAESLVVADQRAAAILLDEGERRFLGCFFASPRTVSSVAGDLREKNIKVLYRVRKLVDHGLLRVAKLEPRPGRAIKHYQASAKRFIVPYRASRAATAAEFMEILEGTIRLDFYESFLPPSQLHLFGVEISGGGADDYPNLNLVVEDNGKWRRADERSESSNFLRLAHLRLAHDDAQALNRDLLLLLDRYISLEQPDEPSFLLRIGLVKLRE